MTQECCVVTCCYYLSHCFCFFKKNYIVPSVYIVQLAWYNKDIAMSRLWHSFCLQTWAWWNNSTIPKTSWWCAIKIVQIKLLSICFILSTTLINSMNRFWHFKCLYAAMKSFLWRDTRHFLASEPNHAIVYCNPQWGDSYIIYTKDIFIFKYDLYWCLYIKELFIKI